MLIWSKLVNIDRTAMLKLGERTRKAAPLNVFTIRYIDKFLVK